ncbi:MAG: hypothetical protein PVF49_06235 [Anaerolineales bacterium]|jgi:hypothetical protein
MKTGNLFYIAFAIVLLMSSACQAGGASTEGASNQTDITTSEPAASQTPPQATRTSLPDIVEPDLPPAGEANVYGRFLWRGVPVAGVEVQLNGLSQEAGRISEERTSNEVGVFYFLNIPIGEQFDFIAHLPEDSMPEALVGQGVSPDWIVLDLESGESISLGDIHILEGGLTLRSPQRGASITSGTVILEWDSYPDAASYRVELKQYPGDYVSESYETRETTLEIPVPQLACLYGWDVTALDDRGEPYARSDQYADEEDLFQATYDGLFVVEDPALPSCEITVISPGNNRLYEFGDDLDLAWEPNSLAVNYEVKIIRTRDAQNYSDQTFFQSNLIELDENGQPMGLEVPELSRGQYSYWVVGYASDGSIVAQSQPRMFTIE